MKKYILIRKDERFKIHGESSKMLVNTDLYSTYKEAVDHRDYKLLSDKMNEKLYQDFWQDRRNSSTCSSTSNAFSDTSGIFIQEIEVDN